MLAGEFIIFILFGLLGFIAMATGLVEANNSFGLRFIIIYAVVFFWVMRHVNVSKIKKKGIGYFFYYVLGSFLHSNFRADERENQIVYKTTHFASVIMIFSMIPIYGARNDLIFGHTITELLVKYNIYDIWGWLLLCLFYIIWGITGLIILSREEGISLSDLRNSL